MFTTATLPRDWSHNRKAFGVGLVATIAFTSLFLALPFVVPLDAFRRLVYELTGEWIFHNPFTDLRLFGGTVGGVITGFLTRGRWYDSTTNAVRAALYALGAMYLGSIGYHLVTIVPEYGTVPLYQIVVMPLFLGIPLALAFLIGGFLGGLAGHAVSDLAYGPRYNLPDRS